MREIGRRLTVGARFPAITGEERPDVELRWGCSGSWTTEML
jgi:hypothetical protein